MDSDPEVPRHEATKQADPGSEVMPRGRASLAIPLSLGARDLALFMAASGLSHDDALAVLEKNKRAGRRPSRVMECE